jgi:hypothetical protein
MDGVSCGAVQKRWDRLRADLEMLLDQRGADMADLPGGASGLPVRGCKGKEAHRLVTRIDSGVVSLVAELRGRRQAAEDRACRTISTSTLRALSRFVTSRGKATRRP